MESFNPDTYLAYVNDEAIASIKSLQTNYQIQIASAKAAIENIDFSGWDDSISFKLSNHSNSLKNNYYSIIEKDVTDGNLSVLIANLEGLKLKCEEYKKIENRSISFPPLSNEDKDLYNSGSSSKMSASAQQSISNYKRQVRKKEEDLETCHSTINQLLANIKNITFNDSGNNGNQYNVDLVSIDDTANEEIPLKTQIALYEDAATGLTVDVSSEVAIVDGKKITTSVVLYTDDNGNIISSSKSTYIVDQSDPRNTLFIADDGDTYETNVNDNDAIIQTYTYTDKNGDINTETSQINETYFNLSFTDQATGNTETFLINSESDADMEYAKMLYKNVQVKYGNVKEDYAGDEFINIIGESDFIVTDFLGNNPGVNISFVPSDI